MIELIALTVFGLCVPEDYTKNYLLWTYDCDWQIHIVEDRHEFELYYKNQMAFMPENIQSEKLEDISRLAGFAVKQVNQASYKYQKIFIHEPKMNSYTMLGCSILWHEILHAWGFDHEEMSLCSYKPPQKVIGTWSVAIPP